MNILLNKKPTIKTLVYTLEFLALLLAIYLALMPFYPSIKYSFNKEKEDAAVFKDPEKVAAETERIANNLPILSDKDSKAENESKEKEQTKSVSKAQMNTPKNGNRLIITKIGVNTAIVESKSAEYGLSKGSWRLPESSTPPNGGNTVITGHRFRYLPPNNTTFYLFHKLEKGDIVSVVWGGEYYYYRIRESRIIDDEDTAILSPSISPIITLFTCHPIYSTEQRLVVVGDLISGAEVL
jgi:sortase A